LNWLFFPPTISIGYLQLETQTQPFEAFVTSTNHHEPIWIQTYKMEHNTLAQWGKSLTECSDGGFAIAGSIMDSSYETDGLLIRTDVDGIHLWNETFGSSENDGFTDIVECQDGGFAIAGHYRQAEMWLVRTDSSGTLMWNNTYAGFSYTGGPVLVECEEGGFAIAGSKSLGLPHTEVWLIRTDANGVHQWNRTYGDEYPSQGLALVEAIGGFVIAGKTYDTDLDLHLTLLIRTSESGNQLWEKTLLPASTSSRGGVDLVNCSDGGFVIARTLYDIYPNRDMLVIRTDAVGDRTPDGWWRTYANTPESYDTAYSITECERGGFLLAGSTNQNAWLVRIDTDGNRFWDQGYSCPISGEPSYEFAVASSIVECSDGGFAFTGDFDASALNEEQVLLVRIPDPDIFWIEEPSDQTLQWGESMNYSLEMFAYAGVDQWSINDTLQFTVNTTGGITQNNQLDSGKYGLHVTVNDTAGNSIHGIFSVTILADPTPPIPSIPFYLIAAIIIGVVAIIVFRSYRRRQQSW
jgi:hypothetical protein